MATEQTSGGGFLLEGLLDRISDLMGDGASLAAFRFAAFEEGRRIGSGFLPTETERLLERLDAVLGHRSVVVADGPDLLLRVEDSRMLASDRPIVQAIGLGVLEGAFLASRAVRLRGVVEGPHQDGGVLVRLKEEAP